MAIGFGIIGFGYVGHKHELEIRDTKGAELIAICDVIPERMDDASTDGVLKFTDAEELLKLQEIDTVVISVENHKHKDMVLRAAMAGKNIICEKPVGMNVAELDEMEQAALKKHVIFTVHQQRRYDKDYRTIKAVFDSNELGDIYTIQSKLCGFNGNMHDWHVYKKYGGGMLYDWGVHLIDQILWMVPAKLTSVYAEIRNIINFEVDDYFKIILKFDNLVNEKMREIYPQGIRNVLAERMKHNADLELTTVHARMPDFGLPEELLEKTDVLIWWAHRTHKILPDELAEQIRQQVLKGMGFIALHSAHLSKPFLALMGTSCTLKYRYVDRARI